MTRWFSTTTRMSKGRGVLRLRYQRWRIDALSISTDNNSTDRTIQNFSNWGMNEKREMKIRNEHITCKYLRIDPIDARSIFNAEKWISHSRWQLPGDSTSSRIFMIKNKLICHTLYYFNRVLNYRDTLVFLQI